MDSLQQLMQKEVGKSQGGEQRGFASTTGVLSVEKASFLGAAFPPFPPMRDPQSTGPDPNSGSTEMWVTGVGR